MVLTTCVCIFKEFALQVANRDDIAQTLMDVTSSNNGELLQAMYAEFEVNMMLSQQAGGRHEQQRVRQTIASVLNMLELMVSTVRAGGNQ